MENFDDLAVLNTAGGKRSKALGKLIAELKQSTTNNLVDIKGQILKQDRIERIHSLEVEDFRGFGVKQNFIFDKQYSLFQGSNGSGKTSLCEALEYSILGTIEEATARNIPVNKYILHAGKKKVKKLELMCEYESGEIKKCIPDFNSYRFSLIEKNRIDGFSHISATTPRTQVERMAALFGLSEFQEFVKGFSTSLDEKYLQQSPVVRQQYELALEEQNKLKNQIEIEKKELEPYISKGNKYVEEINEEEVNSLSDVIEYLNNPETGLIARLNREMQENYKEELDLKIIVEVRDKLLNLIECFKIIIKNNEDILSDVNSLNMIGLYNAIKQIDSKDVCPACHTPIKDTVVNPFENAEHELEKFKKIEEAKVIVAKQARIIIDNFPFISDQVVKLFNLGLVKAIDIDLVNKNIYKRLVL
jgi:DNA repair exonuclease SbcCD ATPase subunit